VDADPRVTDWIDGYVRAWNSNDPQDIGALFIDDATYRTEPFAEPWRGRAEIVERWLERKDEPGNSEFAWKPLAAAGDLAIVEGTTRYREPPHTYSNLWVIRLDADGRCREFTEWWMKHP
jgi:ketosteroid isomerase-like protein